MYYPAGKVKKDGPIGSELLELDSSLKGHVFDKRRLKRGNSFLSKPKEKASVLLCEVRAQSKIPG